MKININNPDDVAKFQSLVASAIEQADKFFKDMEPVTGVLKFGRYQEKVIDFMLDEFMMCGKVTDYIKSDAGADDILYSITVANPITFWEIGHRQGSMLFNEICKILGE